ncbi:MAG TPA: hypothetical protein VLH56_06195 [Dissulfurispiraceae bacterium]|nr:hypothetical protein [Dissulfurispiraceae bacterium]
MAKRMELVLPRVLKAAGLAQLLEPFEQLTLGDRLEHPAGPLRRRPQ